MNKFVITLILMFYANQCLAQTNLHASSNNGGGNLTFEEWMKQNKWDRLEDAIPFLLKQKEKKDDGSGQRVPLVSLERIPINRSTLA